MNKSMLLPVCPLFVMVVDVGSVSILWKRKSGRFTFVTRFSSMSIGDWYFPEHVLYSVAQCGGSKIKRFIIYII